MFSICGKSFKNVVKTFQVTLVERMPRVCKAVIKAMGGYLKNLKNKINVLHVSMCYFIVLMSSLLFYNVEIVKIKKNP